VLPDLASSDFDLFVGLGAIVVASTAISLWVARRSRSVESYIWMLAGRIVVNTLILLLALWFPVVPTPRPDELNWTAVAFFVVLLSLLTTLHDRYRPVHDVRVGGAGTAPPPEAAPAH
jgi:hypothetical protein